MEKILSIRPNKHIMSLLFEIQKYLPGTNRTEIINLGLQKANNYNVDWEETSKRDYEVHYDLAMPDFMQIRIDEEVYNIIVTRIRNAFSITRVTAPFLIKLVLLNYHFILKGGRYKENIVLQPIRDKIYEWITYEVNRPQCSYEGNEVVHDIYRALNDLDCKLTGGNLLADTIFSLKFPLRQTLRKIWADKKYIPCLTKQPELYWKFMRDLYDNTDSYLPDDNLLVIKLSKLFSLGMERCNVMILPERWMQKRGSSPYYDYIPHFLIECFPLGDFSYPFNNINLIEWIKNEHLDLFFADKNVKKENILDLHNTGDVRKNLLSDYQIDVDLMLDKYIMILEERSKYYN